MFIYLFVFFADALFGGSRTRLEKGARPEDNNILNDIVYVIIIYR